VNAVVFIGEIFEGEVEGEGVGDLPTGVDGGGEVAGSSVGGDALAVAGGEG
jgi:hypothetical protein